MATGTPIPALFWTVQSAVGTNDILGPSHLGQLLSKRELVIKSRFPMNSGNIGGYVIQMQICFERLSGFPNLTESDWPLKADFSIELMALHFASESSITFSQALSQGVALPTTTINIIYLGKGPQRAPRLAHVVIVSHRDPSQGEEMTNGRSSKNFLVKLQVFLEKCSHRHISVDLVKASGSYCLLVLRKTLFSQDCIHCGKPERDLVDSELGFPENPLALVWSASRHLCPSLRRALCGHLDRPGTSVPSSLLPERREKGLSELPDSVKHFILELKAAKVD
ncbi:hypothetical protein MG293_017447 [Ovis ammon polii]|uniref:Uncharacterized protein n=1 Tax=Ovis ammon polii TaxID=230172 RepID=A0AAD4Y2U0_OVIAM|nr:hypothetical protein MG293_017447 [Ovis ammon polii]